MRVVVDSDGLTWRVEVISHGRTSAYLNPKVHRPVAQFTCVDRHLPRRYAPLPRDAAGLLQDLDDAELLRVFEQARAH